MSELHPIVELAPLAPIETMQQGRERLAATLNVVPAPSDAPDTLDAPQFKFRYDTDFDGDPTWYWKLGAHLGEKLDDLDPQAGPQQAELFADAAEAAKDDISVQDTVLLREGRWWLNSIHRDFIDQNINQVLRVSEGERHIDVANATNSEFDEERIASIQKVFNAVANFTGGKVFDRVKSVSLLPSSEFADGHAGDFVYYTGMINLNTELLDSEPPGLARYAPFFEAGTVTPFEIALAHELGHAMDVITEEEAKSNGIVVDDYNWSKVFDEKTPDFSVFDNTFGWQHSVKAEDPSVPYANRNVHVMDDAQEIESRELAPTDYARTHPAEDFAESFAIQVLNGKAEKIPVRVGLIGQAVVKAAGVTTIGPKRVGVELVSPDKIIKPIDTIALKALVPAGTLTQEQS